MPRAQKSGGCFKQILREKLVEHRLYIEVHRKWSVKPLSYEQRTRSPGPLFLASLLRYPFNVKRESLRGHPARLFQRIASRYASWKIREADTIVGLLIFVEDKRCTPFFYFLSLIPRESSYVGSTPSLSRTRRTSSNAAFI